MHRFATLFCEMRVSSCADVAIAVAVFCFAHLIHVPAARAQDSNPEDANMDLIRSLTSIGAGDQERIGRWVQLEVERFKDFKSFRERFRSQYEHGENSAAFQTEFAKQFSQAVEREFGQTSREPEVLRSLARVLVDISSRETISAMLTGLRVPDAATRFLSATGLVSLRRDIAADADTLNRVVEAIKEAALAETDAVALGRMYEALAHPTQAGVVLEAYLAVFDRRLKRRREHNTRVDGVERYAFYFFRVPEVNNALSSEQKAQLARRVATFLRMDAERYNTARLSFDEIDRIEQALHGAEEVLVLIVGEVGGNVRRTLEQGGHDNREAVMQQVRRWVGNPDTNEPGGLNQPPWNVPIGAP